MAGRRRICGRGRAHGRLPCFGWRELEEVNATGAPVAVLASWI